MCQRCRRGVSCECGAGSATRGSTTRETYVLSHWAIHPAGSLGSVGSVGPESGETGGIGGVGTAMLPLWRWDAGSGEGCSGEATRRVGEGNVCRGEDRGEKEVVNASQRSGYMAGVRTAMGEWTLLAVVVGIG